MSNLEQLKQKLESDPVFAEQLKQSADEAELLKKIRAAGIEMTPQELSAVISSQQGELDDDELEAVAGGHIIFKPSRLNPNPLG